MVDACDVAAAAIECVLRAARRAHAVEMSFDCCCLKIEQILLVHRDQAKEGNISLLHGPQIFFLN